MTANSTSRPMMVRFRWASAESLPLQSGECRWNGCSIAGRCGQGRRRRSWQRRSPLAAGIAEADGLAPLDDPSIWAERLQGVAQDTVLVGHLPHLRRLSYSILLMMAKASAALSSSDFAASMIPTLSAGSSDNSSL